MSSQGNDLPPLHRATQDITVPKTPSSGDSSSPPTDSSSLKSYASSFAHLLHDNRADWRLFKKKSKPSQHLKKRPSVVKQPPLPRRSASFYQPKVVEDTATMLPPTVNVSSRPPPPASMAATPDPFSLVRPPMRKLRSSQSQSDSTSSMVAPPPSHSAKRAGLLRSHQSQDNSSFSPAPGREHSKPPSGSHSRSRESSRNRQLVTTQHQRLQISDTPNPPNRARWPPETPAEGEPRTPYDTTERHGDQYFRTFGADTIYQKRPSQTVSPPPQREPPKHVRLAETPVSAPPTQRLPAVPGTKNRKRSSIYNVFHTSVLTDSAFGAPKSDAANSPPPALRTPDIKFSPQPLARSRRKSNSNESLPLYFAQSRHGKTSSEITPSSAAVSPMATTWEDVTAESQPAGHVKDISEPTSPFSRPKLTVRPRPKRMTEEMETAQTGRQLPAEATLPVVPSGAATGPQPKYRSSDGKEYYKTSLTGPDALNFLPSEMKRVDTSPLKKKTSGFKGFFFDMRSIPSKQGSGDSESDEAVATKRRSPIIPKSSLQLLLPKLSLPKLKRKASRPNLEEPKTARDPLEVTGFLQTPFSQRYGDARRAKMSQIRSYVEETLKEEDDDSTLQPFELDVPEHLPSSPLCPLSSKHKSGGKAICPIHRRKKTKVAPSAGPIAKASHKQAPRIVFESELPVDRRSPGELEELRRRG